MKLKVKNRYKMNQEINAAKAVVVFSGGQKSGTC